MKVIIGADNINYLWKYKVITFWWRNHKYFYYFLSFSHLIRIVLSPSIGNTSVGMHKKILNESRGWQQDCCNSHQMMIVLKTLLANYVCLKGVQQSQFKTFICCKKMKLVLNIYEYDCINIQNSKTQRLTLVMISSCFKFYFFLKSLLVMVSFR